jgi:hypothetical protein
VRPLVRDGAARVEGRPLERGGDDDGAQPLVRDVDGGEA